MKHINKSLLMAAALVATSASTVLAHQQSDELLSRYTNESTPLAQVDTANADRGIELSMQPGRSLSGIHLHSVWRDRKNDYGGNR